MTCSLFAHNNTPAASFEGSILLCNDYRHHASAPARSESWGVVVDVQVDFTGLAIIRPHRSLPDMALQYTPKVSGALTSLDPRWGRSIRALAMSSLSNSSKPRTSCGRVLEHGTRAGGDWDALTDLRSERQLDSEISCREATITTRRGVIPSARFLFCWKFRWDAFISLPLS